MTNRTRLRMEAGEMSFLRYVFRLSLRDSPRSSVIQEGCFWRQSLVRKFKNDWSQDDTIIYFHNLFTYWIQMHFSEESISTKWETRSVLECQMICEQTNITWFPLTCKCFENMHYIKISLLLIRSRESMAWGLHPAHPQTLTGRNSDYTKISSAFISCESVDAGTSKVVTRKNDNTSSNVRNILIFLFPLCCWCTFWLLFCWLTFHSVAQRNRACTSTAYARSSPRNLEQNCTNINLFS